MGDQVLLGLLAVGLGAVLGVVLFVPFVAVAYRRHGRLTLGRTLVWAAALVYFLAIWTYTLLPLPDPETLRCAGTNLDILAFVDDIRGAIARPGNTFTDPAILQLALNVLLFVPLGFFLRVLGGRGIPTALLVGFALSAFIETTQVTGVWGLYPCAYRVFDVDDLLTNTTGAVLGSILSLVVPARLRGRGGADASASEPRPVTKGRRVLAAFCDVLAASLVGVATSVVVQLGLQVFGRTDLVREGAVGSAAGALAPLVIWTVVLAATGRTVGDLTVELRYAGGRLPRPVAAVLRYLGGIGGYLVLSALAILPGPWDPLSLLFLLVGVGFTLFTRRGRGLPGLLSGQDVVDARAGAVPAAAEGRGGSS